MRLKHKTKLALLCSSLVAFAGTAAVAQDEPAATPEAPVMPDTPLNGDGSYSPQWSNPAFAEIAGMMQGSWKSTSSIAQFGADSSTSTVMTIAPVRLENYPDSLYVEVAAEGSLYQPYYQAVLQFWARGDTVHLRTLEPIDPSRSGAMTAMWTLPAFFPAFRAEDFRGTLDMTLTRSGNGWAGATQCAYPVNQRGAVEMRSELRIAPGSLQVADRFYDMAGNLVSGPDAGSFYTFTKFDHPFTSEMLEEGVWRITMLELDEGKELGDGDRVGFRYWGYIRDGGNPGSMFDSSELPGRSVLRFTTPMRQLIRGWQVGINGMQAGEWHRLIVRSDLGYQGRPAAGGAIPAWSDLIFTTQLQYVEPPAPPAPPAPSATETAEPGPQPAPDASSGESDEESGGDGG